MLGYFYIINHVEEVTDCALWFVGFATLMEKCIYWWPMTSLSSNRHWKKKWDQKKKKNCKKGNHICILLFYDLDLEVYYRGLFCAYFWRDLVKALCSYLKTYCTQKTTSNYQKWQWDQCEAWIWLPLRWTLFPPANVFQRIRGMQAEEDKPFCKGGIWQVWNCFILKKTCFVGGVSCS